MAGQTAALPAPGSAVWARLARLPQVYPATMLVLGLGLLLRAVLLPLTYGGDFGMWSLTAEATLRGQDTYSHPPLPMHLAGPYAYLPLYLYILLPLKWLALHTPLAGLRLAGLPGVASGVAPAMAAHTSLGYVVLGKLPVVVGDVGVAVSVAAVLRRAGLSERAGACGAALFFLNPLVLYNGAFYGRFDSLCLAALLLAWRYLERPDALTPAGSRVLALWYALAVTLKTFPIFLLPYLLWRTGLRRGLTVVVAALGLPLLVSLPYLWHDARRFLYIVFLYDSTKGPRQFSWQLVLLHALSERAATVLSYGLLALFALGLALFLRDRDPYAYAAVAYTMFLLLSKVVYEQYFLWPLPFLAVLLVRDRARSATILLAVLSTTGLLANGWIHPFGYRPGPALWLNALIAAASIAFVLARWRARAARLRATPSTSV